MNYLWNYMFKELWKLNNSLRNGDLLSCFVAVAKIKDLFCIFFLSRLQF